MQNKILSYITGVFLALLIVHPPIDYSIPMLVNSFHWVYIVTAAALFGFYLLWTDMAGALKLLAVYLFANAFFSQVPYLGLNAYIVIVFAFYFFLLTQKVDREIVLRWIETAFWLQVFLSIFQIAGMDKLLCFNHAFELNEKTLEIKAVTTDIPKYVMFGTVMQYMRFSSLLAVMAPFLIMRDRRYIVIIAVLCYLSESSGFALSLIAGLAVYPLLKNEYRLDVPILFRRLHFKVTPRHKVLIGACCLILAGLYAWYDWGSFRGAILPENGGRLITWLVVLKTWVMDTAYSVGLGPMELAGPVNWKWVFLGHGVDTFLPMFPIYKHDPNPFPQAHNSWLQMPWEIGAIGTALVLAYCVNLVRRLLKVSAHGYVAGLATHATNMFFAFPDRMMQTCLLLVAYLGFCEMRIRKGAFK